MKTISNFVDQVFNGLFPRRFKSADKSTSSRAMSIILSLSVISIAWLLITQIGSAATIQYKSVQENMREGNLNKSLSKVTTVTAPAKKAADDAKKAADAAKKTADAAAKKAADDAKKAADAAKKATDAAAKKAADAAKKVTSKPVAAVKTVTAAVKKK